MTPISHKQGFGVFQPDKTENSVDIYFHITIERKGGV